MLQGWGALQIRKGKIADIVIIQQLIKEYKTAPKEVSKLLKFLFKNTSFNDDMKKMILKLNGKQAKTHSDFSLHTDYGGAPHCSGHSDYTRHTDASKSHIFEL